MYKFSNAWKEHRRTLTDINKDNDAILRFNTTSIGAMSLDNSFELQKQEIGCDVVILFNDNSQILVHSVILMCYSEFFLKMFTIGMLKTISHCVNIVDIDPVAVCAILRYMYTGKMELNVSEVSFSLSLYAACDQLFVHSIKTLISIYLCKHIDIDHCVQLLDVSLTYNSNELQTSCIEFIIIHFTELISITNLSFESLKFVLLGSHVSFISPKNLLSSTIGK